jgi:hypothetical protein
MRRRRWTSSLSRESLQRGLGLWRIPSPRPNPFQEATQMNSKKGELPLAYWIHAIVKIFAVVVDDDDDNNNNDAYSGGGRF